MNKRDKSINHLVINYSYAKLIMERLEFKGGGISLTMGQKTYLPPAIDVLDAGIGQLIASSNLSGTHKSATQGREFTNDNSTMGSSSARQGTIFGFVEDEECDDDY